MKKILWLVLLLSLPAAASTLDQLRAFIRTTHSATADFTQTVLDQQLTTLQRASGTLVFSRPGKFRWQYQTPYPQLIVGDGDKLWLYDQQLKQVTVRKLGQALGSTPAALLAGDGAIEQYFHLKDLGKNGALDWLEATPKQNTGSFASIRLGFRGDMLAVMELHDHFGQTTIIRFHDFRRNPPINPAMFRFTPPPGVDVIGE